jgi:hypothetical protein
MQFAPALRERAQEVGNISLAIVHSSDMCMQEDASVKAVASAWMQ